MGSEEHLRGAFARAVYVHAVGGPLTHNAGCLIEGLRALKIPVRVNTPHLTSRPVSMPLHGVDVKALQSPPYAGFDGYIIDISHTNTYTPFEGLKGGRLAYLNQSDVSLFSRMPDPHLMFVAHESRLASRGGRREPIAFGISEGLIAATATQPRFQDRTRRCLRNFRASLSQSVRALLDIAFVPHLERHIPIDRTISPSADYLRSLLNAQVCLAYGGDFYSPIMENTWFARNQPELAAAHSFSRFDGAAIVTRWDSWRFWESLTAGCLTVHLNFATYGFALPVMPEAWVHYVPIDLADLEGSVDAILAREREWPDIAAAGRAWAIAHYAPRPTAARVLTRLLTEGSA